MQRNPKCLLLAAIWFPVLAACGAQDQDTSPASSGAVDRIVVQETRNARKPDESRGIEIRRVGFESIFAGTAIQYSATFKQDNLIDLGLSAHRLAGEQMVQSGAALENLPMTQGAVTIDAEQADSAPGMTLTGVPGYENVSMRMRQGTVDIVSLAHKKDSLTGIPVIKGFELNFEGRFLAFSDDANQIVAEPAGNRGVSISGVVRYHSK